MNPQQPNAGESMSFEEWWKKVVFDNILNALPGKQAFEMCWKARDKEIESLKAKLKVAREALEWCRMNSDASKEIIPGRTAQLALFAIERKEMYE